MGKEKSCRDGAPIAQSEMVGPRSRLLPCEFDRPAHLEGQTMNRSRLEVALFVTAILALCAALAEIP